MLPGDGIPGMSCHIPGRDGREMRGKMWENWGENPGKTGGEWGENLGKIGEKSEKIRGKMGGNPEKQEKNGGKIWGK